MKTEEKFVVMDALELSVPEIEQYLQQSKKLPFASFVHGCR